jgi:lipoprotein-releasing system permease protein
MPLPLAERLIIRRYLSPRRQEGFLSVIAGFSLVGIALGVATLIIVMSVMNGFRAELMSQILGVNGHVRISAGPEPLGDYAVLAEKLAAVPDVVHVTPLIEGQVMITEKGTASGALVRGLAPADIRANPRIVNALEAPDYTDLPPCEVMIGVRMAERLGLKIGDALTVVSPQFNRTAFGVMPRYKTFRVGNIFSLGMFDFDNNFIFMSLDEARGFFRLPDGTVGALDILAQDNTDIPALSAALATAAARPLMIRDWQQANASFFNAVQVERNVMFLILTLIILVAAFNIISSLIMLVKNKTRDIAVLRTLGATPRRIMRIFMTSGLLIGGGGTISGVILGVAFTLNIERVRQVIEALTGTRLFPGDVYFLAKLPAKLETGEVTLVCLMALTLSFLAALYPAWRAGRIDPGEALRYE